MLNITQVAFFDVTEGVNKTKNRVETESGGSNYFEYKFSYKEIINLKDGYGIFNFYNNWFWKEWS